MGAAIPLLPRHPRPDDGAFRRRIWLICATTEKPSQARGVSSCRRAAPASTLLLNKGSTGFPKWAFRWPRDPPKGEERDQLEDQLQDLEAKWINLHDQYVFQSSPFPRDRGPRPSGTILANANRTGREAQRVWSCSLPASGSRGREPQLRELWSRPHGSPLDSLSSIRPYYGADGPSPWLAQTPSCNRGDVPTQCSSRSPPGGSP